MVRPFLKHYQVVGRETPSEKNANPTVFKYEVFAPNHVVAKSRFWRLMNDKNKVKSTKGDILSCSIVRDKKIEGIGDLRDASGPARAGCAILAAGSVAGDRRGPTGVRGCVIYYPVAA